VRVLGALGPFVTRLERARWAIADMAYRSTALEAVGGFGERFRRATGSSAGAADVSSTHG
jgi:hypothetical protein